MIGTSRYQQYYGRTKLHAKSFTYHTPFKLVYGQEAVVSLEFLIPSLRVAAITHMTEQGTTQERLNQLLSIEED
jgi:hypothetical protein